MHPILLAEALGGVLPKALGTLGPQDALVGKDTTAYGSGQKPSFEGTMIAPCVSLECGKKGKLTTAQAIEGIYAEAQRRPMPSGLRYTENVDPNRCHRNFTWKNPRWQTNSPIPDYNQAIKRLMDERSKEKNRPKIRKDAVLVRSMIYSVSPTYFFPEIADWPQSQIDLSTFEERGRLDMEKVIAWKDTMHKFLQDRYGDALLSWQLHMDETSPHLHVQIVPVTKDGRLSAKELFAPAAIKEHLTSVAKACAPLGIKRAREGGNPDHIKRDPQEWGTYAAKEREYQTLKTKEPKFYDSIPENLLLPPKPDPPQKRSIFASREKKEAYANQIQDYEEKLARRPKEQQERLLKFINDSSWIVQETRQELEAEKKKRQAAEDRAKKAEKLAEEAALIKNIPLSAIIEQMYPDMRQDQKDKSIWRIGNRKISITKDGRFIDNHDHAFNGKGAIDFVMRMDECGVKEAIGKIRDYFGSIETLRHIAIEHPAVLTRIIDSMPSAPEPTPPPSNQSATRDVIAWMHERGISQETISHLFETGQVYGDERKNCIVPRENGGYFARGTVKLKSGEKNTFKRTAGSKKAGAGILRGQKAGENSPTILAEGIADAIALVDMYPASTVYIIGGNLYPELPPLQEPIYLAFDSDEKGIGHREHYKKLYPQARDMTSPQNMDWSEWHQTHPDVDLDFLPAK